MNQPLIFRGSSLVFCSINCICSIDLFIFPIDPILACKLPIIWSHGSKFENVFRGVANKKMVPLFRKTSSNHETLKKQCNLGKTLGKEIGASNT